MKNAATTTTATIPTKRASQKASATQAHQAAQSDREVTLIRIAVSDVGDTKKALVAAIRAPRDFPAIRRTSPAYKNFVTILTPVAATVDSTKSKLRPPRRFRPSHHPPAAWLSDCLWGPRQCV